MDLSRTSLSPGHSGKRRGSGLFVDRGHLSLGGSVSGGQDEYTKQNEDHHKYTTLGPKNLVSGRDGT